MKKILVIGASGFVGSHLTEALLRKDYSVRCLTRNSARMQSRQGKGCKLIQGDVSEKASLRQALQLVDVVYISLPAYFTMPARLARLSM